MRHPRAFLLAIPGLNVRHDLDIEPVTRGVSSLLGNVCSTCSDGLLIGLQSRLSVRIPPAPPPSPYLWRYLARITEKARHSRPVQYLNNILEQDHRAIKRRVKAKQSFCQFRAARRTIEGYEAMHMIRKGQARWVSDNDVRQQNQFIDQLFDLAA